MCFLGFAGRGVGIGCLPNRTLSLLMIAGNRTASQTQAEGSRNLGRIYRRHGCLDPRMTHIAHKQAYDDVRFPEVPLPSGTEQVMDASPDPCFVNFERFKIFRPARSQDVFDGLKGFGQAQVEDPIRR